MFELHTDFNNAIKYPTSSWIACSQILIEIPFEDAHFVLLLALLIPLIVLGLFNNVHQILLQGLCFFQEDLQDPGAEF